MGCQREIAQTILNKKEDYLLAVKGNRGVTAENLTVCRHIAMNLLSADESFKTGIKRKQKRAGRNNE